MFIKVMKIFNKGRVSWQYKYITMKHGKYISLNSTIEDEVNI